MKERERDIYLYDSILSFKSCVCFNEETSYRTETEINHIYLVKFKLCSHSSNTYTFCPSQIKFNAIMVQSTSLEWLQYLMIVLTTVIPSVLFSALI